MLSINCLFIVSLTLSLSLCLYLCLCLSPLSSFSCLLLFLLAFEEYPPDLESKIAPPLGKPSPCVRLKNVFQHVT